MRRNFLLAITAIVTMGILIACDALFDEPQYEGPGFTSPTTESTEEYSVTYQYKEGVIVLDENSLKYLERVEADTILYFSEETPISILPKRGDVISAKVTEKTPYGLGNIVTETSEVGGLLKCVTTATELDNIFEELKWEYTSFVTDTVSGYIDENGNYIEFSHVWYDEEGDSIIYENPDNNAYLSKSSRVDNSGGNTIGHSKLISANFDKTLDKDHKISGSFSLGAYVHCSGDIKDKTFNFYIQPIADFSGKYSTNILDPTEQRTGTYKLFNFENIIHKSISLGPLVLKPYVDCSVTLTTKTSGTIDITMGKTFSAIIGYSQQKNGYIENMTKDGSENRILKYLAIDGKASMIVNTQFNIGLGLYTKRMTLKINPYIENSFSLDCRLTSNENNWRINPTLNYDIKAGASGELEFKFWLFDNDLNIKFLETNLLHKEWPILPTIDENTFSVERNISSNDLIFDAKYRIKGGLLSMFDKAYPGIAIYKGSELIYKKTFPSEIQFDREQNASFTLDGLTEDVTYTARPTITIIGKPQELNGIPFSSTSPTAAITDIVQTSSQYGYRAFYYNGKIYDYEYKFYINSYIIGSKNCQEWGLYDPSSKDLYYEQELKDGRQTAYWTGWSNNPSATWTQTPYVILLDGTTKMYEAYTHTCHYNPTRSTYYPITKNNEMTFRLDSIVYHNK